MAEAPDSGTDSGVFSTGPSIPSWMYRLKGLATNPVGWLRHKLTIIVVGGVMSLVVGVADMIQGVGLSVESAWNSVGGTLEFVVYSVGGIGIQTVSLMDLAMRKAAMGTGFLEPLAYPALWLLMVLLLARAVWALVAVIPGVSYVEEFLEGLPWR